MIVGLILGLMIYFDAPADTYWWAAAVLFFGGLADIGFSVMTHQGKAAPPVAPAPAEEA